MTGFLAARGEDHLAQEMVSEKIAAATEGQSIATVDRVGRFGCDWLSP